MNTIDDIWQSYRSMVIPKGASDVQVIECRRAFYAGSQAILTILNAVSSDAVSENAGVAILQGIASELEDFVRGVGSSN